MSRRAIVISILTALFFRCTLFAHLKIFGASPDLVLTCVIFFALFYGSGAGIESGLFAGILTDLFSLDYVGINTFLFALTGFLVGALNDKFFKESRKTQFSVVLIFTVLTMSLHFLLESLFSRSVILGFAEYFIGSILPVGIYSALVAVVLYARMIDILGLKESEEYL